MVDICNGRKRKEQVVQQSVAMYEEMFEKANEQSRKLQAAMEKYFGREAAGHGNDPIYGGGGGGGDGNGPGGGGPRGDGPGGGARPPYLGGPAPRVKTCHACGESMILRSKKDNSGWFIGTIAVLAE